MKYNILTVASKSYFPFLDVFLNSLFKNCDTSKLNKIYIVGVDLGRYRNYLYNSNKIVFLDDDNSDEYNGVHSDGWYKTTKLKTRYLYDILKKIPEDESLLMIDSDTVILEDFHNIINKSYDLQICKMSDGAHISASGVLILHIACFMIFNNIEKSNIFVNKWIENIDFLLRNKKRKPHETPAMNQVMHDNNFIQDYKIESLDDRIVCADRKIFPQTKIIHFKSGGLIERNTPLKNFMSRFEKIECHDENRKDLNYIKYLQKAPYLEWCSEDFNVDKQSFYSIQNNYKLPWI